MPNFLKPIAAIVVCLAAVLPAAATAQQTKPKRPIDFYDQVEITFNAKSMKAIGAAAGSTKVPSDTAEGKIVIFVPKVRDDADGFWETSAVRFASMQIKTGDYSFPMTRVSASIQFIDNRPMRLVIGRGPGGRDRLSPGSMDFKLVLARSKRSLNDYQLEFSDFSYALYGKKDVEFVSDDGRSKVTVLKQEKAEEGNNVDFGFSIGSYTPDR